MKSFTQYTQAAPDCVCYNRGYVIDGSGDFAACPHCEAGAAWKAEHRPAPRRRAESAARGRNRWAATEARLNHEWAAMCARYGVIIRLKQSMATFLFKASDYVYSPVGAGQGEHAERAFGWIWLNPLLPASQMDQEVASRFAMIAERYPA